MLKPKLQRNTIKAYFVASITRDAEGFLKKGPDITITDNDATSRELDTVVLETESKNYK